MSEASTEIPSEVSDISDLDIGSHAGYVFESNSEKQLKLFSLCRESVNIKNCGLLYIAGKQGVKGIRLSLIDTGFDVASYQKNGQMKIIDSEEWFLESDRKPQFKPIEQLKIEFTKLASETIAMGYRYLVVISETDMLVRKGFLSKYIEFDASLGRSIRDLKAAFICAFDRRELLAAGIKDPATEISELHSVML
ncbi:MAG TPA: MEDS domain-containing protein [Nitrososphaerales archaeon]|nr:MEDS domain-containing protein [Nitrososphaerales archaeon]